MVIQWHEVLVILIFLKYNMFSGAYVCLIHILVIMCNMNGAIRLLYTVSTEVPIGGCIDTGVIALTR